MAAEGSQATTPLAAASAGAEAAAPPAEAVLADQPAVTIADVVVNPNAAALQEGAPPVATTASGSPLGATSAAQGDGVAKTTSERWSRVRVEVLGEEPKAGHSRAMARWDELIDRFEIGRQHTHKGMQPGVRRYYRQQNVVIDRMVRRLRRQRERHDRWVEDDDDHTSSSSSSSSDEEGGPMPGDPVPDADSAAKGLRAAAGRRQTPHRSRHQHRSRAAACCGCKLRSKHAINLSFAGNLTMAIIKVFAAVWSGSLAMMGSAVESLLDVLNSSIIFCTARAAAKKMPHKYPVGRARLEPVSLVVFSAIMGMTALVLFREAATSLVQGLSSPPETNLDTVTVAVMAVAVGIKGSMLALTYRMRDRSATVAALVQDHAVDATTNLCTMASLLVTKFVAGAWFVDPLTAMILACYIFYIWLGTGLEQVRLLVGRSASPEVISRLTRHALTHHPRILYVETVRAYHHGSRLLVEIDIVLPESTPLREAHDIGEELQRSVEALDMVERCFVHLDVDLDDSKEEHVVKEAPMLMDNEPAAEAAAAAASPATAVAADAQDRVDGAKED